MDYRMSDEQEKKVWIKIGDYTLWDMDEDRFGITCNVTGEMGTFRKDEFIPYVSSFFGLNF
jgi:hypothetical protein